MNYSLIAIRLAIWAAIACLIHAFRDKRTRDWPTSIFIGFIIVSTLSGYSGVAPIAQD